MVTFLNDHSDMTWLFETHLSFLCSVRGKFHSAMLYGNEDAPDRIDLYPYKEPTVKDLPFIVSL